MHHTCGNHFSMDLNQEYPYHSIEAEEALGKLGSDENGLDNDEARKRLDQVGSNKLPEKGKTNPFLLFLKQFKDFLVLILAIAAVIAYFADHMVDVYVIIGVIILNALIGFFQEYKAEKAIRSLKKLIKHKAVVVRDGEEKVIPSVRLVPGDVILLEEGKSVPADARIIGFRNLQVVESSLTGESMPVTKKKEPVDEKTNLADRKNMLYKGTHIARGTARAVVTATGISTELGKIAESLKKVEKEESNFRKKTNRLAKIMAGIAISTASIVFVLGYFVRDIALDESLLVTIATLVSSIPEGLPAVLSIVLAIGANRMAKRNAIVRDFSATEMAGSLSVILTDKTGTITRSVLTVKKLFLGDQGEYDIEGNGYELSGGITSEDEKQKPSENDALSKAAFVSRYCNNSSIEPDEDDGEPEVNGDPTEVSILVFSKKVFDNGKLPEAEILDDLPFNSEQKYRATLVKHPGGTRELLVIGAPELVLSRSSEIFTGSERTDLKEKRVDEIEEKIDEYTGDAMRVVAFGYKEFDEDRDEIDQDAVKDLVFGGLYGIIDPPRPGIRESVEKCKKAGIRVVMVTGDHRKTALAIARESGITGQGNEREDGPEVLTDEDLDVDEDTFSNYIDSVNVFARVSPQTKLKIAENLQNKDKMIGMTGDGINDAPALKTADVGIAMGKRGTDIARDAAQIVLSDDNFTSIVDAIQEGRIVFRNVRQTSFFLITTNFASTSTLIAAISLGMPYPLLATQVLWVNLVTDGIMDISLATEPGTDDIMQKKPIPKKEPILNRQIIPYLIIIVPVMVLLALFTFDHYLPEGLEKARTGAFLVIAMTQVFNALNMRSLEKSAFAIGFLKNKWVNLAFVASLILQFAAIKLPFMQKIFHFSDIAWPDIIVITLLSGSVFLFGEAYKYIRNRFFRS